MKHDEKQKKARSNKQNAECPEGRNTEEQRQDTRE